MTIVIGFGAIFLVFSYSQFQRVGIQTYTYSYVNLSQSKIAKEMTLQTVSIAIDELLVES